MVIEGIGSYGVVISNPRIPLDNETIEDVENLDEVSKILYEKIIKKNKKIYEPSDEHDFDKEYTLLKNIILEYPTIFKKEYYMIPKKGGIINKKEFIKKYNENKEFTDKWLSDFSNCYIKIFVSLFEYQQTNIYQVIYDKGNKINYGLSEFLKKVINVNDALLLANSNRFFFDDIKLQNLIEHDNTIKIIDFSEIINMNLQYDELVDKIVNSKLNSIYYFPYNIISNILIYESIGKLDIIGKLSDDFDYHSILFSNSVELEENIIYKKNLLDNLLEICMNYIPDHVLNIKVINPIKNNSNLEPIIYEIKSFSIKEFIQSLYKC